MSPLLGTLGDPIWQIGGGIILLAALVLILALRSPEVRLEPQHQWFLTRLTLLVCLSFFLVLSAGVLLFHGANASSTAAPAVTQTSSATASPHGRLSPTPLASPSPSPTPIPFLTPSPAQVLTMFCDAINQHDLDMAWGQYAKALQRERTAPPPFLVRVTIVHCRVEQVSDTSATGYLFLKTVGPNGYTDDYERLFQFTLRVEERAWKIAQIARCLGDGCLDDNPSVVP